MSLPVLVFINAAKGNNPRHLCVVFDKTHPLIFKNNAFSTLIDAPNPQKAFLNSKFTVDTISEYQAEYQSTQNKGTFLKNYATELRGKP